MPVHPLVRVMEKDATRAQLWLLASRYLKANEYNRAYGYRKVWRQGLEVAIKVKSSHKTTSESSGSTQSIPTLPSVPKQRFMPTTMKRITVL